MYSKALLVALAASVVSVAAQGFDWAKINVTPSIPFRGPAVDDVSDVVQLPYDRDEAIREVSADIIRRNPLDERQPAGRYVRPIPSDQPAAIPKRKACQPEPAGAGPISYPDSAGGFLTDRRFEIAAKQAKTPSGYTRTFQNLQTATISYGYLTYHAIERAGYDTQVCADKCNNMPGCLGFNIYIERDPSVNPGPGCEDPPSTTNIKCAFFGGPVDKSTATNDGQWRNNFHVVITASNGYMNTSSGLMTPGKFLGDAAINAPFHCKTTDTYLGVEIWNDKPFDPALCDAACKAKANEPRPCKFFNTYLLVKNGNSAEQQCAMYSKAWDPSYATNNDQWRGDDEYKVSTSWIFQYPDAEQGQESCS